MTKSKVTPTSKFDKNGLDPISVNQHHSQKLSGNQILESFHVEYLPLFELIFKVYYYKDVVTWKDIQKLIQQLNHQEDLDTQVTLVYQKIDVNNHGYISLNQFFKFIIETPFIWEPIYLFRLSLIDGTFTHSQLFTIMKRRIRIPIIKDYLSKHNGKYPKQSCMSVMKQFFLCQPHPDHFDYDNGDLSNGNNNNYNGSNSYNLIGGGIGISGNNNGLFTNINNSNSLLLDTNMNMNSNIMIATTPGFQTRNLPTTNTANNNNVANTTSTSSSPPRFSFFNNQNNLNNNTSNSNLGNNDIITSFSGITTTIIKKFKLDYSTKRHDAFAMKYLSQFNQFTLLAQIDSIYVTYRSLNPVSVKSIIMRSQNHSLVTITNNNNNNNNLNNMSSFSHYIGGGDSNRNSSSTGGGDSTGTTATTPLQSQGRQRPNSILRRSNRLSVVNNNNASMLSVGGGGGGGGETTGRKLTATPIFLGHGRHLSIQSKQMLKINNGTFHVNGTLQVKKPPSIPEKNEVGGLDEEEEEEDSHNSIPLVLDYNGDTPVNYTEVELLYHQFVHMTRTMGKHCLSSYTFVEALGLSEIPLHEFLFLGYNSNVLDWNEFFRFVLFWGFAPMPSIFYVLFSIISDEPGYITIDGVCKLATLLDEIEQIKEYIINLFNKLDLNSDGKLNFHQFCNFAAQTTSLWVQLYLFRVKLLEKFFPNESWRIIFERKRQITVIKDYQKVHNGKLPKQSCGTMVKNIITGTPHIYRYDYDEEVNHCSFYEFTFGMIRLYKTDFKPIHRENFNLKCLGTFNFFPTIAEIDRYYLLFRNITKVRGSKVNSRVSLSEARMSALSSERSHHSSILKPSNYCISKIGGITFGKYDNLMSKSSKSCNYSPAIVRPRGNSYSPQTVALEGSCAILSLNSPQWKNDEFILS